VPADSPAIEPCEVLVGPSGVLVGTGRGAVRLGDVQPAGKRMFPAADWARGARPAPGERVGS
jgi:methionyl-tRNA formyltransferase